MQTLHVFEQNLIPQELFPACIGFVLGGCASRSLFGWMQDSKMFASKAHMTDNFGKMCMLVCKFQLFMLARRQREDACLVWRFICSKHIQDAPSE